MRYKNLAACVADLERHNKIKHIDCEIDPFLEMGLIQRRAFKKEGPALLFTRVKGCKFPMLGNLFGTKDRINFIFRDTLRHTENILKSYGNPWELFRHPLKSLGGIPTLWHALPQKQNTGPVMECQTKISQLPQLFSWPKDGGAFITLPLVCTENPLKPGLMHSNLGMYRIQLSGGEYKTEKEVGMHYQIHRGIGNHHAAALAKGKALPVSVSVGGPPALTMASVMPLPENISEFMFAGMLGGARVPVITHPNHAPIPAQADFCLTGFIHEKLKPEGPFGDHLGYYSEQHNFPVMEVTGVWHRKNAIWPFTSVGRPPQEDSYFGWFIHELTSALIPTVFPGIHEVHAVDAAGVHPLLLAVGSERYTPYEESRKPREILTQGLHLLGRSQTSLAKYLIISAKEDAPGLSASSIDDFFSHILCRTDFSRDIHIITKMPMDTLDYTGYDLHEGSKMIWAAAGDKRRKLSKTIPKELRGIDAFKEARLFRPGIIVCPGMPHKGLRGKPSPEIKTLAQNLEEIVLSLESIPLIVIADDPDFTVASWDNFLWVTFTRSDPATDTYGVKEIVKNKHWGSSHSLIIDARLKSYQPVPLEDDPDIVKRVEELGAKGKPLHGIV